MAWSDRWKQGGVSVVSWNTFSHDIWGWKAGRRKEVPGSITVVVFLVTGEIVTLMAGVCGF